MQGSFVYIILGEAREQCVFICLFGFCLGFSFVSVCEVVGCNGWSWIQFFSLLVGGVRPRRSLLDQIHEFLVIMVDAWGRFVFL